MPRRLVSFSRAAWHGSGFVREDGAPYHPERILVMFKRRAKAPCALDSPS
jgi:hypothetical protein